MDGWIAGFLTPYSICSGGQLGLRNIVDIILFQWQPAASSQHQIEDRGGTEGRNNTGSIIIVILADGQTDDP